MMIGGGGSSCLGADHGIGITRTDGSSFVHKGQVGTDTILVIMLTRQPSHLTDTH